MPLSRQKILIKGLGGRHLPSSAPSSPTELSDNRSLLPSDKPLPLLIRWLRIRLYFIMDVEGNNVSFKKEKTFSRKAFLGLSVLFFFCITVHIVPIKVPPIKNAQNSPEFSPFVASVYIKFGYSHVGDIVILITYSCWPFKNVADRIKILVTSFRCWCPTLMLWDRGCWWPKWLQPSPTS